MPDWGRKRSQSGQLAVLTSRIMIINVNSNMANRVSRQETLMALHWRLIYVQSASIDGLGSISALEQPLDPFRRSNLSACGGRSSGQRAKVSKPESSRRPRMTQAAEWRRAHSRQQQQHNSNNQQQLSGEPLNGAAKQVAKVKIIAILLRLLHICALLRLLVPFVAAVAFHRQWDSQWKLRVASEPQQVDISKHASLSFAQFQ